MSVIYFPFCVNQVALIRKKSVRDNGGDVAYFGRKARNICTILVDNPVGPGGSMTTAYIENQSFLGTDHLFVGPRQDVTILTGGFPVASLCFPVGTTAF